MTRTELFIVIVLLVGLLATFEYMDLLYAKWESNALISVSTTNNNESK
jgi:hypothetical protein